MDYELKRDSNKVLAGTTYSISDSFEYSRFTTLGCIDLGIRKAQLSEYIVVKFEDFANYKDEALEIYPTIVYACTVYFDVICYFGCLRV